MIPGKTSLIGLIKCSAFNENFAMGVSLISTKLNKKTYLSSFTLKLARSFISGQGIMETILEQILFSYCLRLSAQPDQNVLISHFQNSLVAGWEVKKTDTAVFEVDMVIHINFRIFP